MPLHLTQKHTDMELGVVWQPCPETMDAGFSKAIGPPNPPKCEPVWFWEAEPLLDTWLTQSTWVCGTKNAEHG